MVKRGEQTIARLGELSSSAQDITEPDFIAQHELVVMHALLDREPVARARGRRAPPPLWRWENAEATSGPGEEAPPLELYLASDVEPPRHAVRDQRERLATMLALSWSAILGFALAWARNIRSRDLSAALEVERSERARLGDLNLAAAGLAHETMNPLGLIHGFAQQLANDPKTSPQGRDTAEQIIEETDRAAARLSDFINFARHVEVDITSISAQAVIGRVTEALRPEYESGGVELTAAGPELKLACDRGMFEQVLVNLLLNSLAASRPGATTQVTWAREGPRASVTVSDEGGGIEPSLLPDVFKPYVTGRVDGHGLGLAIVKQIADRHGWSIAIESEPGVGTRISLGGIDVAVQGGRA